MVINVVRAKRRASQPLQQIVLFIRSAIRSDKSEGLSAVSHVQFFQLGGGSLRGFFPGNGEELVALAQQRLLQAFRVPREIKTEPALYAQELFIDAGKVAVIGAQDLVIAHAQCGFATVRAVRADGRNILHFPRPRFVSIGAAGQCAHRANINAHPALFAFQVIFAVGDDNRVRATHAHAQRLHIHAFITNTHAAEAQDAARRIVINQVRPLFLWPVNLFFHEPAGIRAVAEHHVLQFALAAFVADRTIQRVVAQQEFQHELPRVAYRLGVGAHHHAFGDHLGARGLQFGRLFHFDQAHPAGRLQRKSRVVAERRHFNAQPPRRFNHQRSGGNLNVAVVNLQVYKFRFGHESLPRTN